ncbi:MAG: hypothetical protein C0424_04135 [Sphingobacteriaceae bacterium]|nr:hypothetical protein [Sphingobacteriaceae bacterium]
MRLFQNIISLLICLFFTLNSLAQTGTAHIYVGLYDNLDKENLQVTLVNICSRYKDFRIFISNDQFPAIITNQSDLNYFFQNQILLLNPTYPNILFELDTLLKMDAKRDFLGFNDNNQPRVNRKVDYYFFIPTESAIRISKELIQKYYQVMGFGDIANFEEKIPIYIYTKEMLQEYKSDTNTSSFKLAFKTY